MVGDSNLAREVMGREWSHMGEEKSNYYCAYVCIRRKNNKLSAPNNALKLTWPSA
jgi:hypothetical protein